MKNISIIGNKNQITSIHNNESEQEMTPNLINKYFLKVFAEYYEGNNTEEKNETIYPNCDNFTFLVFLMISYVKTFNESIRFQLKNSNMAKITIKKTISLETMEVFKQLFEELSLFRIEFIELLNEWVAFINF